MNQETPLINFDSNIFISIKQYGWIEPIRKQGPILSILAPIYTIIDLVNQGIKVEVQKKYWQVIYNLILVFNNDAQENGGKKASKAQEYFEKLLKIEIAKDEQVFKKELSEINPFEKNDKIKELERRFLNVKTNFKDSIPDTLKRQIIKKDFSKQDPIFVPPESLMEKEVVKRIQVINAWELANIQDVELDTNEL